MKINTVFILIFLFIFGIINLEAITVTTPNLIHKTWIAGKTYTIKWNPDDCLDISYKIKIFKDVISPATFKVQLMSSGNSEEWEIPYNFKGNYVIRIKSSDNMCHGDSKVFKIQEARIRVTSPNSSSIWNINKTYEIKWKVIGEGSEKINIFLQPMNRSKRTILIQQGTRNDGRFIWNIPGDITPGKYLIRLELEIENTVLRGNSRMFEIKNRFNVPKRVL